MICLNLIQKYKVKVYGLFRKFLTLEVYLLTIVNIMDEILDRRHVDRLMFNQKFQTDVFYKKERAIRDEIYNINKCIRSLEQLKVKSKSNDDSKLKHKINLEIHGLNHLKDTMTEIKKDVNHKIGKRSLKRYKELLTEESYKVAYTLPPFSARFGGRGNHRKSAIAACIISATSMRKSPIGKSPTEIAEIFGLMGVNSDKEEIKPTILRPSAKPTLEQALFGNIPSPCVMKRKEKKMKQIANTRYKSATKLKRLKKRRYVINQK